MIALAKKSHKSREEKKSLIWQTGHGSNIPFASQLLDRMEEQLSAFVGRPEELLPILLQYKTHKTFPAPCLVTFCLIWLFQKLSGAIFTELFTTNS
jgi:hypothetical protein